MLKAYISERLLALSTTRERAAAIVGDLLELHSGPTGFWFAVMRTAWALSWRFGLGFLLAASAEFFCLFFVCNWAATPPHGVDSIAIFSGWCCALLTAGALFSLVRFGPSDVVTRLSAALAFLTGLDLFFWWMPFMRVASGATAVIVVLLCCLSLRGRAALLWLFGATVVAATPLLTMMYLVSRANTAERCRQGCNLHNAPILVIIPIAFLLSGGIVAGVLGRHQKGWSQLA